MVNKSTVEAAAGAPRDPLNDKKEAGGGAVFTKEQLKGFKKAVEDAIGKRDKVKVQFDEAKGAVTTAYNNAKKAGIPKDELKFIIEKRVSFTEDFKQGVGALEEMLGMDPTFDFVEDEGYDAVRH